MPASRYGLVKLCSTSEEGVERCSSTRPLQGLGAGFYADPGLVGEEKIQSPPKNMKTGPLTIWGAIHTKGFQIYRQHAMNQLGQARNHTTISLVRFTYVSNKPSGLPNISAHFRSFGGLV